MDNFTLHIDKQSRVPRYQQVIDGVTAAISSGRLHKGDALPSVNRLMSECELSRDTVVKAYNELKRRGIVDAVPNKGYFIRGEGMRILLFFDTYSPFKEGLYNSFRKELSAKAEIDMIFHHYNIRVFESLILKSLGKYSFWIVMSFEDPRVSGVLRRLDPDKVLILDLKHYAPDNLPYIVQNFDRAFYDSLQTGLEQFRKYDELVFVCPPALHHPAESRDWFMKFCRDHGFSGRVKDHLDDGEISKGTAYIVVSDNDLVKIVERTRKDPMVLGKDIGLVSYNDTPVKKVIGNGITVISTDFEEMGRKAACFVKKEGCMNEIIPTRLILRSSL